MQRRIAQIRVNQQNLAAQGGEMLRDGYGCERLSLRWPGARDRQCLGQTILRRELQGRAKGTVGFAQGGSRIGEFLFDVISVGNYPECWKSGNQLNLLDRADLVVEPLKNVGGGETGR